MSNNNTATIHSVSYCGTIDSQPVKADVYYAFEVSTNKHDIVVFRGLNGHQLATMRDRTRAFIGKADRNFKSALITVRADNIGRQGLYSVVPIYNGKLSSTVKAQLIRHFNDLGLREWVNNSEPQPVVKREDKDRVVSVVNPVDYSTESYLSFVEAINTLLKMDMVTLTNIAKDNGIPVSHNKVMMAKQIATQVKIARPNTVTVKPEPVVTESKEQLAIRLLTELKAQHGLPTEMPSDEAVLATEPDELPVVPMMEMTACLEAAPKQKQLMPNLNGMTVAQLRKLASANNIVLRKRMSKSELVTLLTEAVNG